jgi:general secretion pathway protein H
MPISVEPSSPDCRREAGFTLVELMVVLAVMGLLAGLAVWRWPEGSGRVRSDAVALSSRIAAARDQAILSGRAIALEVDASGYRFVQRGDNGWQAVTEPALRERRWSRGVSLGGTEVNARLGFDSVGLPDRAMDLTLTGSNARAVVEIAADGEVGIK